MQVAVEVIGLGRDPGADGGPRYVVRRGAVLQEQSPDEVARALAPDGAEVLHSTSWRHEPGGPVVLTYAVAPEPVGRQARELLEPAVVCSGEPLAPRPSELHIHHVAAHAARHLAYLMDRDPGIQAAVAESRDPQLWVRIAATADAPTDTHGEAHRRARRLAEGPLDRSVAANRSSDQPLSS